MSHSIYGPSSAHKWLECAASVKTEAQIPEPSDSEFAAEGSEAHDAAHKTLISSHAKVIDAVPGIDAEMAEAVQAYVDYVRALGGQQQYEKMVSYRHIVPDGYGTADCIAVCGDTLHVVDYKHGKGVSVSATQNPQEMLYALGALEGMPKDRRKKIKKVVIHIVQPRINNISAWETTPKNIDLFGIHARQRYFATLSDEPEYTPGEKQCRFCRAKAVCPGLAKQTEALVMADFADLDAQRPPSPDQLTPTQLSKIIELKPLISSWLEQVETHVKAQIEAGVPFPGWKIVEGRSTRKWADEDAAAAALGLYYEDSRIYTKKILSVAQAEKTLGKEFIKGLSEFVIKPPGAPVLVPEADKRQAISFVTVKDF